MTRSRRYLTIFGTILIVAVILFVAYYFFVKSNTPETPKYNPSGEVEQTIENPTPLDDNNVTNNTDVAESLSPSSEMQGVIDRNSSYINEPEVVDQLTESYPSNLIPIFMAKTAADSNDIITDNGKPGWTATYGSDADTETISSFYEDLLKNSPGYDVIQNGQSVQVTGTASDCNVSVTVSPNNAERTGLDDKSNVSIFIERN